MLTHFLRRIVPLLVAAYVVLFGAVAEASHFRFGNITWSIPDPVGAPRNVRFVVTHGWAAASVSSVTLNFGDGATHTNTGPAIGSGTDVAGTRYAVHRFTVDHLYAASAGAGPFTVFFASCCRIAGLTNGANGNFRVETRVSLAPGNTGGPVTSAPAIISLSAGAVRTYLFPVFDPDFDPVSCRFATSTETSFTPPIPSVPTGGAMPTIAAAPGGCLLTWDLTRATNGQRFVLPLILQSTRAGVISSAPLDVIVEVSSRPSPTCVVGSTALSTGTFVAPVGMSFSASVTGTNPGGGNLTMTAIGAPTGSTLTPVDGTVRASPFGTTFAWTPTMAFFGSTQSVLINYRNTDGLTATCFLTVQVPMCSGFGNACNVGVGACQRTGMTVCTGIGMTACNVTAGAPGTESCNNIDDDCDGMTDEMNAGCTGATPFCNTAALRCDQCRTNADCPASAPTCDGTTGRCRPCNVDAECAGATPACVAGRGCVQCTTTNGRACTGATPVCNVAANTCVQCNSNAECSGNTPICDLTTRRCGACTADGQCGGATPACATSGTNAGACVQCTTANAGACAATMGVCNAETNRCVRCNSDADCSGTTPVCETTTRTCRACRANGECRGATPACATAGTRAGACVQCTAASATACAGMTPVCNDEANRCVQCNTSAQCAGTTPVCDLPSRTCRSCTRDGECSGATPACATGGAMIGACVQCTMANGAACTGMTPVCNVDANRCVQCNTNAQCAGATPVCEPTTRTCRGCMADADCGGDTPACAASGRCVQCTPMSAGACRSPTTVCDATSNRCVQCTEDAQCSGSTPVCDGNMCRACRADMECARREGATACATSGACVQCTATNATGCAMETPVCNPDTSRCVLCTAGPTGSAMRCSVDPDGRACIAPSMMGEVEFCGCARDADCGDATSGRVCDPMRRRCTDGCGVGDGRNGCPMGRSCTADAPGAIGMCTTTCNRDTDCAAPRPVCRRAPMGSMMPNVCVECTADANCAGRMDGRALCDEGSNTCVQCTAANAMACMASGAGAACLMGACGCARDADCGDARSGRVCDADSQRCVEGCYTAEGRNGCPTGRSCTSDDPSTRGTCSTSCNRDADCMAPTPYCRRGAGEDAGMSSLCVTCITDMHCAGRMDGRTVCDAVASTCVQCTESNRMACVASGAGTACLMGACGCTADSECPAGRRCDVEASRCGDRPTPDAGPADVSDAGAPPQDLGMDATPPVVIYRGGGCACSTVPPSTPARTPLALLGVGAVIALRRRARRKAA